MSGQTEAAAVMFLGLQVFLTLSFLSSDKLLRRRAPPTGQSSN